jgi:hypothetical protein
MVISSCLDSAMQCWAVSGWCLSSHKTKHTGVMRVLEADPAATQCRKMALGLNKSCCFIVYACSALSCLHSAMQCLAVSG